MPPTRSWALTWAVLHLLGFSLGGWLALQPGIFAPNLSLPTPGPLVFMSGLSPLFLVWGRRQWMIATTWILVGTLSLAAGFVEARTRSLRKSAFAHGQMQPAVANTVAIKALVRFTSWPSRYPDDRWKAVAVLVQAEAPERSEGLRVFPDPGDGILVSSRGPAPQPGQLWPCSLELAVPSGGDLPGMFDYRKFLQGRNIQWQAKVLDALEPVQPRLWGWVYSAGLGPFRTQVIDRLEKLLPRTEAALMKAVLLGAKTRTSRSAGEAYSDLGLAHLFAVSGLHVGVLLGLFLLPARLLGIPPHLRWALMFSLLVPYALLTGLPGSVVRAAGLALLATAATPLGRRGQNLHCLGFLFWITTLWQPCQGLDIGVKLSYSAAGGILAFNRLAKPLNLPSHGWQGLLVGGLSISLAAQWWTLPLVAASFGRISLLSPLANLLVVPLFGAAVWLVVLSLAISAIPWLPGPELAAAAWALLRAMAGLVGATSENTGGLNIGLSSPVPHTVLLWLAASAALVLAMKNQPRCSWGIRRFSTMLGLCFIVGLGAVVFNGQVIRWQGPRVWQFDVGQGDCALLVFPDGWSVMIDTAGRFGFSGQDSSGPLSRSILPWMRRHRWGDPDLVVLSHGHLDHTGGARTLLDEARVGRWLVSGTAGRVLPGPLPQSPTPGEVLHRWRQWTLEVLYPLEKTSPTLHENDHSLVLALKREGEMEFLWSGDLEKEGEEILLRGAKTPGRTRVWKAGHHGSSTSGSQGFIETIAPRLIVVSSGVGNGYHHPSHGPYVVDGDTIAVVRTDLQGSVHLRWNQRGDVRWFSAQSSGHLPHLP